MIRPSFLCILQKSAKPNDAVWNQPRGGRQSRRSEARTRAVRAGGSAAEGLRPFTGRIKQVKKIRLFLL